MVNGQPSEQLNRDLSALPAPTHPPSPEFDPASGTTVFAPPDSGPGWWVGAPSALWTGERFYLSYRIRRPKPERGSTLLIAESSDGTRFDPIWNASKAEFGSSSMERAALVRVGPDHWRLYVSYVDGADDRWRIDLLEARSPDAFDPADRQPVLTAAAIGAEGVKDPWVARLADGWCMFVSYAPAPANTGIRTDQMHGTKDVFNTGLTSSVTGLATSADGRTWHWEGSVLEPSPGEWDGYASRLNTVIGDPNGWIGFYDGSSSVAENYEERCGLVTSTDRRTWRRNGDRPAIGAAGGPGTVRYVEAVQAREWTRFYYEYTRPDGSHELRTSLHR